MLEHLNIPLEDKLRALIAGMRYAAGRCDDVAKQTSSDLVYASESAKARTMRSDADAIEALLTVRDAR